MSRKVVSSDPRSKLSCRFIVIFSVLGIIFCTSKFIWTRGNSISLVLFITQQCVLKNRRIDAIFSCRKRRFSIRIRIRTEITFNWNFIFLVCNSWNNIWYFWTTFSKCIRSTYFIRICNAYFFIFWLFLFIWNIRSMCLICRGGFFSLLCCFLSAKLL